jgi:hypothetical protein
MAFLAPLFFVGLVAIAVPIIVHLIQRERKEVIEFPSLMFLRQIPYQSVERRRIHNWPLLLLRAAAMLLFIAAFSRPFLKRDTVQAASSTTGAREVVILLDHSASMGYADRWDRARDAARRVVSTLGGEDRATLVLFGRGVEEAVRATSDRGQLESAIADAKVSSDGTRYAPALRWAQSKLTQSALPRKEVTLISDFQKTGWERQEEIHFPEGTRFEPVSVATPGVSDVSVTTATFQRGAFSGEERVGVTVGLTNRGSTPVQKLPVRLEVDGRVIDTRLANLDSNASASVSFPALTVSDLSMRGTVHAGSDQLAANNAFHFVLSPSRPVSVLVVQAEGEPTSGDDSPSYFLTTALSISTQPPFRTDVLPVSKVTAASLERRALVVLNDTTSLPTQTSDLIRRFVEQGGGLLAVVAERTPWAGEAPLLPGKLGAPVQRLRGGASGTLGFLDYSHKIFELFKDPRNGNFSAARFHTYRTLQPAPTDRVLARFDDGAVAMAERRVGSGRVIAWTSSLDLDWTDFPQKMLFPVFAPLVATYLARYEEPASWHTVGRVLDVSVPLAAIVREGTAGDTASAPLKPSGVIVSPSGEQSTLGEGGVPSIELAEQGFYSVRMQGTGERRPFAVAVNLDPAESDLTPLEPHEFANSVAGRAAVTPTGQSLEHPELTPADIEKKQSVWWFLLVGGALALLAEALLSNRLSRKFGVGFLQMGTRA